jgi:hypothetical protein
MTGGCTPSDPKVAESRYVEKNLRTHYLTDDDGNVVFDVPPPILQSVFDQISAKGDKQTLNIVQQLYDVETGQVRDEAHAQSIGQLLKTRGKDK